MPDPIAPQTITRLSATNILRLKAVEIIPDGNLIVIGGENANGKTSVLTSIAMAIGGKRCIPDRPIREGQSRAEIILETQDFTVELTMKAASSPSLVVKKKDGSRLTSPQAVLDALTSKIAFDPLDFIRLDPKKQAETLRTLAGIDFTELDAKRATAYAARTALNAKVKDLESLTKQSPFDPELPAAEISVTDLAGKLQQMNEQRAQNQKLREKLTDAIDEVESTESIVERRKEQHAKAEVALVEAKSALLRSLADRDAIKVKVEALTDPDTAVVMAEVSSAEETNRKIRANLAAKENNTRLFAAAKEAKAKTNEIEDIDAQKAKTLEEAKFPVPDLSFDETGVVYQGVPFGQASGAEQLRVSMAVAMALNPTLKVCLIRDGSLLDDKNLALVAEMAAKAGGQCWLERVSDGPEVSVVIEDGSVKEVREPKKAAPKAEPALA